MIAKAAKSKQLISTANRVFSAPLTMANEETKHRTILPLYDLQPSIEECWIAPNATVVGEVRIQKFAAVWHNAVVRGDINRVE
jgi:hypothetical protein